MTTLEHRPISNTITAVFVDRDGVLNEKMPEGEYVRSATDFRLLPGVGDAIRTLNDLGILVLVVTNQRGIALGRYSLSDLNAIHESLIRELQLKAAHLDGLYVCPHDKNCCECRKPGPGLFLQALKDFRGIKPETSIMIGDSLSDIEFGKNLGMKTILIEGRIDRQKPDIEFAKKVADLHFHSLLEAVESIKVLNERATAS